MFLDQNRSGRFESRFSSVSIERSKSVLLAGLEGSRLGVWVAHGEGRFAFRSSDALSALVFNSQVALRFVDLSRSSSSSRTHRHRHRLSALRLENTRTRTIRALKRTPRTRTEVRRASRACAVRAGAISRSCRTRSAPCSLTNGRTCLVASRAPSSICSRSAQCPKRATLDVSTAESSGPATYSRPGSACSATLTPGASSKWPLDAESLYSIVVFFDPALHYSVRFTTGRTFIGGSIRFSYNTQ